MADSDPIQIKTGMEVSYIAGRLRPGTAALKEIL